jgi:hypothetical protein
MHIQHDVNQLETEREEAISHGNAFLVLGIALLLGFLVQYLSGKKNYR